MRIVAALPWYDETVDDLRNCVRGLANIADHVIALDGAYVRFPDAKPQSDRRQVRMIMDTCAEVGLTCNVFQQAGLWAGQVQKRSYLLALAAMGADWILTVDADHVVHCDREQAREELATISEDVVAVPCYTPLNDSRPIEESSAGLWHQAVGGTVQTIPQIYRNLQGLRIERFHYWYSALKDGERVWLWCDPENHDYPHLPWAHLKCAYHVEHRCLFRQQKQILANRAFCNDRAEVVRVTGQEDHIEEIPVIHDYETVAP